MRRLLIGLGHPFRSDDAAGIEVARRVRSLPAHERMTASYELMDLWEGADDVIVVDATHSGASAGTVRYYDPLRDPLPRKTFASSHGIGLAETIAMAEELGRLPSRVLVCGIEAGNLSAGTSMSPAVEKAVARVVRDIDHA